ncbi:enoyl-CoA hydratase/isomerase family protein [Nocardia bovistercoris]|uniref:Enoyl-CoA hydratase/isomerase family protein n=1 Tax=Nocardia bovistercoris TaxID=2785916 RepID=A0A931I9J5_9NOCA|nr:enoyl-CoA hydratase/isomerase family protein [Nocardia bovistercoris]
MIRILEVTASPHDGGLAEGDIETTAPGPVIAVATAAELADQRAAHWLEHATLTLSEAESADRRVVTVDSVDAAIADLERVCGHSPISAAVCDDVLRANAAHAATRAGLVTESLAYSTLQAGPEFARWLAERGPVSIAAESGDAVLLSRVEDTLELRFNRPHRHNAFDNRTRVALLEALTVARLDPTVRAIRLSGAGGSFCSGGDLAEFGGFTDPAHSHLARTRYSPALAIDAMTRRLGRDCRAQVHGRVLGSGLEMAAFFGWVRAHPDTAFALPELGLGLIPGAGGTVSVTRRMGRWRTAFLIMSGRTVTATTALAWGLVDEIGA